MHSPLGCRFTGTLPTEWADSRYFSKLQTLDVHDNQLDGTLPSQKWNKKGAFKSLQSLDLSQNNFYGGLGVSLCRCVCAAAWRQLPRHLHACSSAGCVHARYCHGLSGKGEPPRYASEGATSTYIPCRLVCHMFPKASVPRHHGLYSPLPITIALEVVLLSGCTSASAIGLNLALGLRLRYPAVRASLACFCC